MSTKLKILEMARLSFNELGLSQVSCLMIATELEISPGNLYYHFGGKEELISALLNECELALAKLIARFEAEAKDAEAVLPFVHSVLRVCLHYQFVFRDQEYFRHQSSSDKRKWLSLIKKLKGFSQDCIERLSRSGHLKLSQEKGDLLAENMMLLGLSWLNYDSILAPGQALESQVELGVKHLMSNLSPWLQPPPVAQ
ncbi:TetR/AcrR family transcriptional regulator [Paraferrimonas sedimenticola]|uniref:TetR family transcriptional regulator n=1 Tax=Paraferrimonas sedimenticola TaxID=375674 RepID=A0AA37RVB4_9GAMM|nr:TetR/AcrR family transcriptional regulator [Paraferrimonas sedimenticola]GLP95888.1 TetR family transcriptional regulator [Paraferrimonas sedimenticola]